MQDSLSVVSFLGFREPFGSLSHLSAAIAALAGWILLLRRGHGNFIRLFSLSVFSFSLIFLFSMSGVYHIFDEGGLPRAVFQRLDHAAIWILITGTFTPIHTLLFRGKWRWGFLAFIWTVAIIGLILEIVFFQNFPEWLSLTCYLTLGWMGVLTGWKYSRHYGFHGARLLVLGGLSYSAGGVLEFLRWPILIPQVVGPHELFHLFVIGGAFFHWYFVYERAGYPVISKLIVHVVERPGPFYVAKIKGDRHQTSATNLADLKKNLQKLVEEQFPLYVRPEEMILEMHKEDVIPLNPISNL